MNAKVSEAIRLATLADYRVAGSVPDPRFDAILSALLQTTMATIGKIVFVDDLVGWVKSANSAGFTQIPRSASFSAKYIVDPNRTVIEPDLGTAVPDMQQRLSKFNELPCAAVAGVPLVAPNGSVIGALLVIDTKPRDFTMTQIESLTRSARKIMELLESSKAAFELAGGNLEEVGAETSAIAFTTPGSEPLETTPSGDNSHAIVDEFVKDNLVRSGWWAAQVWWAEDEQLFPEPWIVDPAAPEVVTRLRSRSGSVPIPFTGVEYSQPTLVDLESAPWLGNIANIGQSGVRHIMVLDIVGALGASLRLVFVVPEGVRVRPETLSALETGALLLPRVLRQEQARGELLYRSTHDALTGLLNRRGLDQVVSPLEGSRTEQLHAVIYLDLDHFKQVNDTHGHAIGDQLLKYVSTQIMRQMRPTDSVVRLGGDEFVVLATNIGSSAAAYNLGRRLLTALNGNFVAESAIQLKVAASIGVAIWRTGGLFEEALRVADALMYQAKQAGGSLAVEELAGSTVANASTHIGINRDDLPLLTVAVAAVNDTKTDQSSGLLLTVESPLRAISTKQVCAEVNAQIGSRQLDTRAKIILRFSNHFWNHGSMIPAVFAELSRVHPEFCFAALLDASLVGAHPNEAMQALAAQNGVSIVLSGFGQGVSRFEVLDQLQPVGLAFGPESLLDFGTNNVAPSQALRGLTALASALDMETYAVDQPESTKRELLQGLGIKFYCNSKPMNTNNQGE